MIEEDIEFKNIKTKSEAIRNLYPSVSTIYPGENWKCVDIDNNEVEINESLVTTETSRLQAAWDAQEYARNRKEEYDALNQFELISDDDVNGTTTHKDAIAAIKTKYPKG